MAVANIETYASCLAASRSTEVSSSEPWRQLLGRLASLALISEALLTPKPALVDRRGSGAHSDLTLESMLKSAMVLEPFFQEMANLSSGEGPSLPLREELAECGRRAEIAMHQATGGSNSHRGAIWCLGLLVAGASMQDGEIEPSEIAAAAAQISAFPDRNASNLDTHGLVVKRAYGVGGARIEAQSAFPHVIGLGLPHLRRRRLEGASEITSKLDALMAIMSNLDDTCLLFRGGLKALQTAKTGAKEVIDFGGTDNPRGINRLFQLDSDLLHLNASPGGSADLLAATIFLDSLDCLNNSDNKRMMTNVSIMDKNLLERRN